MRYQKSENSKDNWQTPPWLFELLHQVFNFTIDGAADDSNHLLPKYYTDYFKALPSHETIFINPPFSQLKDGFWNGVSWMNTVEFNKCLIVMLQPFRPETKYWHNSVWGKANIFVFNRRIQYVCPILKKVQQGVPMPSALVIYGDDSHVNYRLLADYGILIRKNETYEFI